MTIDTEPPAVLIEDVEAWAKTPIAMAYDKTLGDKAIRVFVCLYQHGTEPGSCYPSHERIAECIGGSPRSIARPLLALQERGWVRCFRRDHKGLRLSNGYALALRPETARRNAKQYVKGAEPEALRLGRLAATAQESADVAPAQESAGASAEQRDTSALDSARKETQVKETQGTTTASAPTAAPRRRRREPAKVLDPLTQCADDIARHVWENRDPKPAANFMGVRGVLRRLLDAGWLPEQVQAAAMAVPALTVNAMEFELNRACAPVRGHGSTVTPSAAERREARNDAAFDLVLGMVAEAEAARTPTPTTPGAPVLGALDVKELTA